MRLLFIALLLFPTFSLAADQWTEVKSPHFTVITDAGEKRGREVAVCAARCFRVLGCCRGPGFLFDSPASIGSPPLHERVENAARLKVMFSSLRKEFSYA